MFLKDKTFYDLEKTRTFGRLKGRKLTKNQIIGLEQGYRNIEFDPVKGAEFFKKKSAGLKLVSEMVNI